MNLEQLQQTDADMILTNYEVFDESIGKVISQINVDLKSNYIFDFGKVIVEFEPEVMLSPYIADNSDRELAGKVVFDRIYWDKLDAGTITDDEVIAAISARLPERLRKPAIAAYQNWYRNLPLIDGMCELIEKIKKFRVSAVQTLSTIIPFFNPLKIINPLGQSSPL